MGGHPSGEAPVKRRGTNSHASKAMQAAKDRRRLEEAKVRYQVARCYVEHPVPPRAGRASASALSPLDPKLVSFPSQSQSPPSRSCDDQLNPPSTCRSATPSGWPRPGSSPRCESRGDSYDNALAESVIGLYKTEVIRRRGPWCSLEDVEFATLEWA